MGRRELLNMPLQKKGDSLRLNFRSIGDPFDLSTFDAQDIPENYRLLTALVDDYAYNYTIGMNYLRVSFDLSEEDC